LQQAPVAANTALDDVLLYTYTPISHLGLPLHQKYLELAPNDARKSRIDFKNSTLTPT
jgi:hypothetical protein